MLCISSNQWRRAIAGVNEKLRDLPSLMQFHVAQEALYTWQWAKATWSQRNPSDYWTGRYRGSVTISVGAPDAFSLPEHPDVTSGKIEWPPDRSGPKNRHPDEPYMPVGITDLMERVRPSNNPVPVFVSDAVPYAGTVEQHAHPRAVAYHAALGNAYDWAGLVGPLV